jgi:hypothetical protein
MPKAGVGEETGPALGVVNDCHLEPGWGLAGRQSAAEEPEVGDFLDARIPNDTPETYLSWKTALSDGIGGELGPYSAL